MSHRRCGALATTTVVLVLVPLDALAQDPHFDPPRTAGCRFSRGPSNSGTRLWPGRTNSSISTHG